MKLTLSWLRDFAPIEGSADEIGRQLTDLGLAVEEQAPADAGMHGIVVARVLDLRPHPDADLLQHPRMDHAAAAQLEPRPVGALDVELGRRLGEREVGRPEPGLDVRSEVGLREGVDRARQVPERDAAVDHQALDLVEDGEVGRVGGLVAVHPSRHDRVERGRMGLHEPDLHR